MRVLAFFAALFISGGAFADTPVRFALDWRFEGPAAPYFVAIDKGYYKAEGLNVTIDPGSGSVEGINRVASGAYEVGFADINSLVKYRDNPRNLPVKAVMMVYDTPAFSIVSLKKNGIAKPKDLEGKVLGAPAADGAYAQWPIFVQANKIDASKVKIENVGFPVREPMLAQGKVDAIAGFWFSSYMNLKANGVPGDDIVVLLMRDFGVDLYGNVIIANPDLMRHSPRRRLRPATIRASGTIKSGDGDRPLERSPTADVELGPPAAISEPSRRTCENGLGGSTRSASSSPDQIGLLSNTPRSRRGGDLLPGTAAEEQRLVK
jgi:NitT/TauT family transport system substrate-binding protein